ncbi:MAG: hypothetical protein ACI80M_000757 [Gammaproteobacteria bacterium]|jgi:hypothetical protein|tara:strand:- start:49 stop:225 length:177 start_codon:yes stop_codon:yes gene_type:complete
MMTVTFITFINLLNPYLLTEHLKMSMDIQGDFTGNMYVFTESAAVSKEQRVGEVANLR